MAKTISFHDGQMVATDGDIERTKKRVYAEAKDIFRYDELIRPTSLDIHLAIDRIAELSHGLKKYYIILDLTKSEPPSPDQRACLKECWSSLHGLQHIAAFTGKNSFMNIIAKFVISSFKSSFSMHRTITQARKKIAQLKGK